MHNTAIFSTIDQSIYCSDKNERQENNTVFSVSLDQAYKIVRILELTKKTKGKEMLRVGERLSEKGKIVFF